MIGRSFRRLPGLVQILPSAATIPPGDEPSSIVFSIDSVLGSKR